jgi:hypothetical protein
VVKPKQIETKEKVSSQKSMKTKENGPLLMQTEVKVKKISLLDSNEKDNMIKAKPALLS